MSSIGPSSSLDGSVDSNVGDHALLYIQSLGFGIRLKVLEQHEDVSAGLLGPSTLLGIEVLSLSSSTGVASVSVEGNHLFVINNIFQISYGFFELKTFKCSSCFEGVLEMNSQIISSGFGG